MTDGKARAAALFQGLANSAAREATRRATRRFCKLLQPARERGSILTLAACGLSPVDSLRLLPGAFESPTSTINTEIIMALVAGLDRPYSTRLRLVLYDYLDPDPRAIISRTA